jgi:hypothetical protein
MNQNFAAIILGGTGQVDGAAVTELLAIPECREVVMFTRKPIAARSRVRISPTNSLLTPNCRVANRAGFATRCRQVS